jgi:hypothetical protein
MVSQRCHRRKFLQNTMGLALGLAAGHAEAQADEAAASLPPVRPITHGPGNHWFGYYDKLQFDPSCRYALGMKVDFEHRSPRPNDVIKIGMVDLQDDDRWIELGRSSAWGWQQGCMLQWRPGSRDEILWNDRQGNRFVCHILNVHTREKRTLGQPIYTLSPDGQTALSADFRRINVMRPGYGYAGLADPYEDDMAPQDSGIYAIDLDSGQQKLVISLADIAGFGQSAPSTADAKHYFNHLLCNTDGSRFIFLHRWRLWQDKQHSKMGGFHTRLLTAGLDGKDTRVIDPHGKTSHFIWRDPDHILAWAWHPSHGNAFYLYDGLTGDARVVGKDIMTRNGHCTYLPGNEWILNDTYPDRERKQTVYLYHSKTGKTVTLGRFHLPPEYSGEWRCDTHPRFSPDGRKVIIDSPHLGRGRQMHLIDISSIVL